MEDSHPTTIFACQQNDVHDAGMMMRGMYEHENMNGNSLDSTSLPLDPSAEATDFMDQMTKPATSNSATPPPNSSQLLKHPFLVMQQ